MWCVTFGPSFLFTIIFVKNYTIRNQYVMVANTPKKGKSTLCSKYSYLINFFVHIKTQKSIWCQKSRAINLWYQERRVVRCSCWKSHVPELQLAGGVRRVNQPLCCLYFIQERPCVVSEVIMHQSECHARGETSGTTVNGVLHSLQPLSCDCQCWHPWFLSFFVY